ncbi:MAG: methyl-accepting chemotaxis protein [Bdellovibrionales bacterium]|nr:methyl-accepting chemotaxis protein [Bdellovibrionales bacterium]
MRTESSFVMKLKSLKYQILFLSMLPIAGFCVSGYSSYLDIKGLNGLLEDCHNDLVPTLEALGDFDTAREVVKTHIWEGLAHPNDVEDRKKMSDDLPKDISDIQVALSAYEKTKFGPYEKANYPNIKKDIEEYLKRTHELAALIRSQNPQDLAKAEEIMDTEMRRLDEAIDKYSDEVTKEGHAEAMADKALAKEMEHKAMVYLASVTFVMGGGVAIALMVLGKRIVSKVSQTSETVELSSVQVSAAIEQLSAASNELANASTKTAASLEEAAATVEELSELVGNNCESSKKAADLAEHSSARATSGEGELKQLLNFMQNISASSKKMLEILDVIDDIAFQTNLLALNASVEAARAGEQGKGFAVVAEAVRNLAQRSSVAAKDINVLISKSAEEVNEGVKASSKSGDVLRVILEDIKKISAINREIAAGSEEQSNRINMLSQAIEVIDTSSQGNAASAEEISATSLEIAGQSEAVQKQIQDLGTLIHGKNAA